MKVLFIISAVIAAAYGFDVNKVTGTTPPAIHCPNSLCYYKKDGNYKIANEPNYFVQCSNGLASCQACFPLHLIFREDCNQCLKTRYEKCATTEPWYPATTFHCPDVCPKKGYYFSGNTADPHNRYQYVACWKGKTVGCIACPTGLVFNEQWNACVGKKDYHKNLPYGHDLSQKPGYGESSYGVPYGTGHAVHRRRQSHGRRSYPPSYNPQPHRQRPYYPRQHRQRPYKPQQHRQRPYYPQQHRQRPYKLQQHQQRPYYPQQHGQYPRTH